MRQPPRAVVFDAYGTLFDVHAAAARHAGRLGAGWPAVSALWRQKQLEYTWVTSLTAGAAWQDFEALTRAALLTALNWHGGADAALVEALMGAYRELPAYPEVPAVLGALREAGVMTAILSNGSRGMLEAAVGSAKLAPLLDAVLSVDAVRVFKPDPRVYRLAEDEFGCHAREMGFVSSNAWDAQAAAAYGFRTVWVNRLAQPTEYALHHAAAVLPDLDGVAAHFLLAQGPAAP
jgi:2-haloacid dehalogenase